MQDMGIDTSNNPADFERQYTLALLAAEYGDFSGLEALGITPSAQNLASFNRTASGSTSRSSGGGSSGGSSGSGNEEEEDIVIPADILSAMRTNYPGGVVNSKDEWDAMVGLYGEDLLASAGFSYGGSDSGNGGSSSGSTGSETGGESLSDMNTNTVLQLGIGPVSLETVEQLVEEGKVDAFTDSNGKVSVRWVNGYNANNWRSGRNAASGLNLASFLPTPLT